MSTNLSGLVKMKSLVEQVAKMTEILSNAATYSKMSEGWKKAAKGTALAASMQLEVWRGGKSAVKQVYAKRAAEAKQEAQKATQLATEQAEAVEAAAAKAAIAAAANGKGRKAKRKLQRLIAAEDARQKAVAATKAAATAAQNGGATAAVPKSERKNSIRERIKTKFDNPPNVFQRNYRKLRKPLGNDPIHVSMEKHKGTISAAGSLLSSIKDQSLAAAKTFSTSFGVLRSVSGASEQDMGRLVQSFKVVGGQVPQSLNEVAKALGILSRDTTLTDKGLEIMSKTVLDASRLTGTDSAVAAEAAAKAMGVWGIATESSAEMMDKFFAASRAGNVNMGDLMKKMGQAGDPLRKMGIGFDQSVALLSKWQKEGLNPIEDALKKPLPSGGISEIAVKIRNAGTAAEAAQIATEIFGEKVSGDLVAALRGGTTEFNGILGAMDKSKGAIANHSQAVMSFGDRFDTLQNRITIALAPLGEAFLPFGEAMATVVEFITRNADILTPAIVAMSAVLVGLFAPSLWASAVAGWAAVAPFLPIIAVVALVGAAVAGLAYLFKRHMEDIMKLVQWASDGISSLFGKKTTTLEVQSTASLVSAGATSTGGPPPAAYHGMDYVPYDGMIARLHKGERIMTASENREFSQGGGGPISITGNTFNVRQESDIDAIARALAREIKTAGGLMA